VSLSVEKITGPVDPDMVLFMMGVNSQGLLFALAFITTGEDVYVLDIEPVNSEEEGRSWFEKVRVEQPWVDRH
jgi:hypothetical protein